MKKIITFFLLIAINTTFAQVVCNLAYERTLAGFNVYIHTPSGATMYRAKMYIDSDGSPRSYGPNNTGLDYTANAGYPGNWWALVTDVNGNPIIQTATDPYPGMYVSTTSLVDANYATTNPLRYVNSETVPFIAMPTNVLASGNVHVGDVAYVYNTTTGQHCFAIYADAGNTTSIGEASIYTATQVGVNPNVRTGGTSSGIIDYVVFPHSGFGQGYIPTIHQIDSIGNSWLYKTSVGGPCIVGCLGPMYGQAPPSTLVSPPTMPWDTTNFTANFIDTDTSCIGGIAESLYQVTDYNTNNDWRANNTNGFFNDDFNGTSINADWTNVSGTWSISSGVLQQTDQTNSNSNLYAPLTQTLSNSYLYSWTGTMGGTGTTRRAGFHFFADQPDSSNRGNSYFVYFRLDDDKIQTYKVTNNSWGSGPVKDTAYNFTANQAYDFKVLYNRITGVIQVFVNDILASTYTDSSPITSGGYVSFRNANSTYAIDNFKVFRSRNTTANILVGSANTNDIRFQNQNPATPAGKISSIITNINGNISSIATQTINVDFTHPAGISVVKDGTAADIDTTYNGTQLQANWSATADVNSNIANYYYAIGTTAGAHDVVNWTNNGNNTFVTATGLSLVNMQKYFISVQAQDGAMMKSTTITSNGQIYLGTATAISQISNGNIQISIYPNPNNGVFNISTSEKANIILVSDMLGNEIMTIRPVDINTNINLGMHANGIYFVKVITDKGQTVKRIVINK